MSEVPTKERIILAAEELMLAKGFHAVGLTELLKAVKVPKGSFYHHFKSKEHFGIELLQHYVKDSCTWKREGLADTTLGKTPMQRMITFLQSACDLFKEGNCQCPCLILKLTAEVSGYSEAMRNVVKEGYTQWISIFEKSFQQAQNEGSLPFGLVPTEEAQFVIDYWYGATHRSIATRSPDAIEHAISIFRKRFIPEDTR